ncbi:hypothetical protein C8F01DRAFT_1219220 [Mycena amicta]|nr:hypothetical protein C8F01DRAFT_1219220 [Mycena amicta]
MAALLTRISPPKFAPERDIPDLSGRVILVTGGNSGIGYETVKQLLLKNATVYLAARSPDKAAQAIEKLAQETNGKRAVFLCVDLADLVSVRRAAEEFLKKEERLDVLFNNGGVMNSPPEMLTAQKYDLQFGTNVIGHFFLTDLLLPALLKSISVTGSPARIVHTSSIGHNLAPPGGIEYVSLKDSPERDAWVKQAGGMMAPLRLYGESKLGNILISNYFAKLYPGVIVSCAVHPGPIKTELGRHSAWWLRMTSDLFFYPTPVGAYTQLWAGTTASVEEMNTKYFVPFCKLGESSKQARDEKLEKEVVVYIRKQLEGY